MEYMYFRRCCSLFLVHQSNWYQLIQVSLHSAKYFATSILRCLIYRSIWTCLRSFPSKTPCQSWTSNKVGDVKRGRDDRGRPLEILSANGVFIKAPSRKNIKYMSINGFEMNHVWVVKWYTAVHSFSKNITTLQRYVHMCCTSMDFYIETNAMLTMQFNILYRANNIFFLILWNKTHMKEWNHLC